MKTSIRSCIRGLAGLAVVATAAGGGVTRAQQATIYRCHALDGQLIFQDKPCDQVAGTQEARKGSAGDIIPNAPPAPVADGPPLAERYENYLDAQAARRVTEAAAEPPAPAPGAAGGGYAVSALQQGPVETYSGYNEGVYPVPVYVPYPVHPPYRNGGGPPAPAYDPRQGPQALPPIMQEPSLTPPRPPPRGSAPGHVVARDPSR